MTGAVLEKTKLSPDQPGHWLDHGFEQLFELSWRDCEEAQLKTLKRRFEQFRSSVQALRPDSRGS